MVTIRKIDVGSAFRIGALVTGIISLVLLLPILLCQLSLVPALTVTDFQGSSLTQNTFLQGAGVLSILLFYVCGTALNAVFGGIFGAIYALIYNLVSRQFGGLQVEVDGLSSSSAVLAAEKAKNTSFFDSDFETR